MNKSILATVAIAGLVGTVALPTIVSSNERRTSGTLSAMHASETPFIAALNGDNEVPGPGDPDGTGAATVSFGVVDGTNSEVCWDMAYSGIADPAAAHIHEAPAGVAGDVVVDFGAPTPNSFSGCTEIETTLADEIMATPGDYYVNIHNADFPAGAIRGQLAMGPEAAGSTHFLPTPLRAYDSRIAPATKMAAGDDRTISLASGANLAGDSLIAVPPGATAALVTLTATETDGPSFLKAYSAASPEPATSNLNFTTAGVSIAVSTQVAVDASGRITLTAGPAGTHVIVDVVGYLY